MERNRYAAAAARAAETQEERNDGLGRDRCITASAREAENQTVRITESSETVPQQLQPARQKHKKSEQTDLNILGSLRPQHVNWKRQNNAFTDKWKTAIDMQSDEGPEQVVSTGRMLYFNTTQFLHWHAQLEMSNVCNYCGAKKWSLEAPGLCCSNGKMKAFQKKNQSI